MPLRAAIAQVVAGRGLTEAEMAAAMGTIMDGEATPAQVGALLVGLRMKGETVAEVTGAAQAMRQRVARVRHDLPRVLDTCGTGGDGAGTFNVSTAVAFVCAAAGVPVAKHGNRAVSSRSGSADVLEALGVRIDLPSAALERCLAEVGLCFLFAPAHHPAMRHLAGPRRELGVRTMMNLLGPLTNPAGATHQLVGIYDGGKVAAVAEVLGRLGARRAVVVHGEDGLDEVSPCGPTLVAEWSGAAVRTSTVRPEDLGLTACTAADIAGGDAATNAAMVSRVLSGEPGPARTTVALNAAFALYVAGEAATPRDGVALAEAVLDSGRASAVLAALVRFTNA